MTPDKDIQPEKITNNDIEEILEWTPEEEEEFLLIMENIEKCKGEDSV